jgi:hypothetical protein
MMWDEDKGAWQPLLQHPPRVLPEALGRPTVRSGGVNTGHIVPNGDNDNNEPLHRSDDVGKELIPSQMHTGVQPTKENRHQYVIGEAERGNGSALSRGGGEQAASTTKRGKPSSTPASKMVFGWSLA